MDTDQIGGIWRWDEFSQDHRPVKCREISENCFQSVFICVHLWLIRFSTEWFRLNGERSLRTGLLPVRSALLWCFFRVVRVFRGSKEFFRARWGRPSGLRFQFSDLYLLFSAFDFCIFAFCFLFSNFAGAVEDSA
jgi:hypothetical protein